MDGDSGGFGQRGLHFRKMHGLGNDFVVIDARGADFTAGRRLAIALGDRRRGVGFDQMVVVRDGEGVSAELDFWNADGTEAAACGNATRCVARLLMTENGRPDLDLRTRRGVLHAEEAGRGLVRVNMGLPVLDWRHIPLARDVDIDDLPLPGRPSAVGMGNPHCIFLMQDVEAVDIAAIGPEIEHDPLFPERTNVEFVEVLDRSTIRMRVWERGGMITLACGSGACAAAVAVARRGLADRELTVRLDGGDLGVAWRDDGVWMTGPTTMVFEGQLSREFLEALP